MPMYDYKCRACGATVVDMVLSYKDKKACMKCDACGAMMVPVPSRPANVKEWKPFYSYALGRMVNDRNDYYSTCKEKDLVNIT